MDVSPQDKGVYAFGPFRLDPVRRTLHRDGTPIKLAARLFDTLVYLVQAEGRLVEKDELLAAIWGGRIVEEANLTQTISSLRKALHGETGESGFIVTAPGRGYRFALPVELLTGDVRPPMQSASFAPPPAAPKAAPLKRPWQLPLAGIVCLAVLGMAVWEFGKPGSPPREPPWVPPSHSVAVLAFSNLSGDPGQDYLSDGISEELIDELGRLDGLRVAARVSAFSFKGSRATVAEIGRKLNVGAVLEGSVRHDGDRMRITAELIDATTGYQLWSQHYDRPQGSLLQMQDDIAERVTEALRIRLLGDVSAQLTLGGTANAQAFDAYLHGRSLEASTPASSDMPSSAEAALADFDRALALDPHYALAEAARGAILCSLSDSGRYTPSQQQHIEDDALQSARRAVSMAPELGMAYARLAVVLQRCSFDFAAAEAALSRALALAPGDADVLSETSSLASDTEPDRALPLAQLLVTLDPLNPQSYYYLSKAFFYSRRYEEAASALDHAASLRGRALVTEEDLRGMVALLRGDPATAVSICRGARNWHELLQLAVAYHQLGRPQDAAANAARLHNVLGDAGSYQYAELATQWGRKDEALDWLETAYRLHDSGLTHIMTDPWLDPIRTTARFREIVHKLNLAP